MRILPGFLPVSMILGTALLVSSPAFAEEPREEDSRHPLRPGAWALEFEVQPRLYGYYGAAGIALKHHFTTRSAFRLGVLAAINHSDTEGTRLTDTQFPGDTTYAIGEIRNDLDRRDVTLFAHAVRFLGLGDRFGMFLEAGPTLRWVSEEYGYVDAYPPSWGTYRHGGDRDAWNYGLDAAAGFEWFFSRRLSLAGRYGIAALITQSDQTDWYQFYNPNDGASDYRLDVTNSNGAVIQTTPAVIALTAYF